MNEISIDSTFAKSIYKPAANDAHKGILGHALVIGGSHGKMGAITLCAKAALKSGCGLTSAFIPECGYAILQTAIPEVMVVTDEAQKNITSIQFDLHPQAIGIGPGLGTQPETQRALHKFLISNSLPLIVDADALNILSLNKEWLHLLPENSILTPHPKELERLIGKWQSDDEKINKTIALSKQFGCIVILKGAPTNIICDNAVYVNTTGNAALATAGSGDVLTGIVSGLVAQGYAPVNAACLAVYLHGKTADIALPETGVESFVASDIIANIGTAFLSLSR